MATTSSKRREMDIIKLMSSKYEVNIPDDNKMYDFNVKFRGPLETPYVGGIWKIHVLLPNEYPYKSPSIGFLGRIFHPNIDEPSGSVCLDVINQSWSPMYDLVNIFEVFLPQLLRYPNPSDPLNGEAAHLLLRDPEGYNSRVRDYVRQYASIDMRMNDDDDDDEDNNNNEIESEAATSTMRQQQQSCSSPLVRMPTSLPLSSSSSSNNKNTPNSSSSSSSAFFAKSASSPSPMQQQAALSSSLGTSSNNLFPTPPDGFRVGSLGNNSSSSSSSSASPNGVSWTSMAAKWITSNSTNNSSHTACDSCGSGNGSDCRNAVNNNTNNRRNSGSKERRVLFPQSNVSDDDDGCCVNDGNDAIRLKHHPQQQHQHMNDDDDGNNNSNEVEDEAEPVVNGNRGNGMVNDEDDDAHFHETMSEVSDMSDL